MSSRRVSGFRRSFGRPARAVGVMLVVAALLFGVGRSSTPAQADDATELPVFPQPRFPDWTNWLEVVNYWRTLAAVESVTEETSWSQGAFEHARYLVRNDATGHEQDPALPDATPDGALAAKNGNVLRGFADPERAIEAWMRAPFHAAWVVNPRLTRVGFGSFSDEKGTAATLDVIRGIEPKILKKYTVFPGQGTYVKANTFIGENPDPRERCPSAYTQEATLGLPLFALLVEPPVSPSATLKENGRTVEICTFTGPATLASVNGVYILPRHPLRKGARYDVFVRSGATTVQWNFWVIGPPGTVRNVSLDTTGDAPVVRWSAPSELGGLATTNMVVGVTGADGLDRQIPLEPTATEFPLLADDVVATVRVWAANVAGPGAALPAIASDVSIGRDATSGSGRSADRSKSASTVATRTVATRTVATRTGAQASVAKTSAKTRAASKPASKVRAGGRTRATRTVAARPNTAPTTIGRPATTRPSPTTSVTPRPAAKPIGPTLPAKPR